MAGTDAKVFITFFSRTSASSRCPIGKDSKKYFERSQEDVFVIEAEDVGELGGIRWVSNFVVLIVNCIYYKMCLKTTYNTCLSTFS